MFTACLLPTFLMTAAAVETHEHPYCQALLRRLEKRIYVGLPDSAARTHIFSSLLKERGLSPGQLAHMSSSTQGHSGSDIASLCKEVAMR